VKKIFDENYGLAVYVFSAAGIVFLLASAYVFKPLNATDKHYIEREKFHLEVQKF
jgi:hypothetical protein